MLRLVCKQACAFGHELIVLRPGTYKIDRLTAYAVRKAQPHLVQEGLLQFIETEPEPEDGCIEL